MCVCLMMPDGVPLFALVWLVSYREQMTWVFSLEQHVTFYKPYVIVVNAKFLIFSVSCILPFL